MSLETYRELEKTVFDRKDSAIIEEMDVLANIYEGVLPADMEKFFPKNTPKQIVNLTRLAWDDLATQIGRLPDLRADTVNNTDKEEATVALLERVGHNYLRNAEPSGKLLMWQLAWWLIGVGRAVVVVTPDTDKKMPVMGIRDPRTAFPGARRTVGNMIVELEDIIFEYDVNVGEMEAAGLKTKGVAEFGQQKKGRVYEFIDDTYWIIASDGGTVIKTKHNMGVVPAWVYQTFAPNKEAGLSQFQDQITFMVAISRFMSQKLAMGDRLINPIIWTKGLEGEIEVGPQTIMKLGPQGEIGQLDPPTMLQVDRDIELLGRFARVLNRNPEVRQGEIAARGQYTSAKTLEQLSEAIDTVIGRIWDIVSVGTQNMLKACYTMDEKMWGGVKKPTSGIIKGQSFSEMYVPNKDIAGRNLINVDYGFGLGGYQGFLQQVQAKEAGLNSKKRAVEQMPGISDVNDLLREIELEQMDESMLTAFRAQAEQGQLDVLIWSKLRNEMARKGKPLAEIIPQYEEELRAQAQQAVEQGGAEALTTPPTAEAPPAPPQLPGVPPSALIR